SRLGVFIPKRFENHVIRINNNMNEYAFLITLIHEMAHASIWEKYGRRVNPHGEEWKDQYRKMMLPFLNPEFFPEDVLRLLSNHMINPKATTVRDLELYMILKKYDKNRSTFISEINDGDEFSIDNGKRFVRIEKLRKNYKCKEISTGKLYRFSPLAEVKLI
ncbi:MAG TPA: SprT-like domain-containing protein, partial [Flavobacteriales bacterium]|nr:SprT-like domain-containing protein [Flavobacteriales bacterium]